MLRISYEPNYAELEVALYDDYKVEPIRSYRSETASVTVNTDTASRLVEDGRSLSLPSTVDRIITTSTNNGAVKITTHTEQTVDSQIVSKDADSFITMADAFAMAADIFKVANSNEKRQILSMLLSNLYFDGENLTYTLKEPPRGALPQKTKFYLAGATGIEPISTVLETAILTVVLRPYNIYYSRCGRVWGEVGLIWRLVPCPVGFSDIS